LKILLQPRDTRKDSGPFVGEAARGLRKLKESLQEKRKRGPKMFIHAGLAGKRGAEAGDAPA